MKTVCHVSLTTFTSIAALLAAGSAFAAQNVANTSQKGSLLVFPLITVDVAGRPGAPQQDTFIEISNDGNSAIHVECEYVNERKGRVNFDFGLTAKQTVSWDVLTRSHDGMHPASWPTNAGVPSYPGNVRRGELICFATDAARAFQIAWNHLTGTATVMNATDDEAFKYNAWAFAARGAGGLADDNRLVSQGTPGRLDLTGENVAGAYDACPAYNIGNFMPNGARLGNLTTLNNTLAVVSCNQDLREQYKIHRTKLEFTVWNSREDSFTGAFTCVDSVNTVRLGVNSQVTQGSNFNFSTVATPDAMFEVRGLSATPPCPAPTEASGLLSVLASTTQISPGDPEESHELTGNTLHGAGVQAGFVLWDPSPAPQPGPK